MTAGRGLWHRYFLISIICLLAKRLAVAFLACILVSFPFLISDSDGIDVDSDVVVDIVDGIVDADVKVVIGIVVVGIKKFFWKVIKVPLNST